MPAFSSNTEASLLIEVALAGSVGRAPLALKAQSSTQKGSYSWAGRRSGV